MPTNYSPPVIRFRPYAKNIKILDLSFLRQIIADIYNNRTSQEIRRLFLPTIAI